MTRLLIARAVMLVSTSLGQAATFTLTPCSGGPNTCPGATTELKVNLNGDPDGTIVTGQVKGGGPTVIFSSTNILESANGYALIDGASGPFSNLTISVPGYTFTDVIFRAQGSPQDGTDSFRAIATYPDSTQVQSGTFTLSNTAAAFIALSSSPMANLLLQTVAGNFDQLKHFQISGLAPVPTPLPGALVLMGSILAGGAGMARWRRRRADGLIA